jgi:PIN domain
VCLIIDTSKAAAFFNEPWASPHAPISRWISIRNGQVVYGGLLRTELEQIGEARRVLKNWVNTGRANRLSDEAVTERAAQLQADGVCISNDHHILAVALLSGARVLFTGDNDLATDFQNAALIAAPRGHVYRTEADAHHLRHTTACGQQNRKR